MQIDLCCLLQTQPGQRLSQEKLLCRQAMHTSTFPSVPSTDHFQGDAGDIRRGLLHQHRHRGCSIRIAVCGASRPHRGRCRGRWPSGAPVRAAIGMRIHHLLSGCACWVGDSAPVRPAVRMRIHHVLSGCACWVDLSAPGLQIAHPTFLPQPPCFSPNQVWAPVSICSSGWS